MTKTANTPENKAKFFAQYWGQQIVDVCDYTYDNSPIFETPEYVIHSDETYGCLLLRPLPAIADEEAIEVAKIFDLSEEQIKDTDLAEWIEALFDEPAGYYIDGYTGTQMLQCADYLRSKSFAIPYMDLSVEDLIVYNWITLTN